MSIKQESGTTRKVPLASLATAAVLSVTALFAGSSAYAQVANTTQPGSLLVWPLVSVDQSSSAIYGAEDTFVELSNNSSNPIQIECYYVNETKAKVDFSFNLTGKQTVSWDVYLHKGDHIVPPPFPTSQGNYNQGSVYRGELVCFAVDNAVSTQVAWNELTGTATVLSLNATGATQPKEAFKYNAWSFCARNASGCAPDDNVDAQGTPGILNLTGQNATGVYDACPAVNIANFMPNKTKAGPVTTIANNLSVTGCDQDLHENNQIYKTKLLFNIWNSDENSFSGTYVCTDSVETEPLTSANTNLVNGYNFDHSTLRTADARFEVSGISNQVCSGSNNVGLLGVLHASTGFKDKTQDQIVGNTLYGTGSEAGFVYWEPY